MRRAKTQKRCGRIPRRLIAIVVMSTVLLGLMSLTVFAQNNYIITDGDNVTVHKSYSSDPDVVLDEVGIELSEEDTYTTTYNDGVNLIDIQRMQMVTVNNQGKPSVIGTYGETVAELLERAGILLGSGDTLSCEGSDETYDGMVVEIVHREVRTEEYDEIIPCDVNYYEDPTLDPDEELVLIEGTDGVVHYKMQTVYENGEEVSREVVDRTVTVQAETRLVICGIDRSIKDQPDEPKQTAPARTETSERTEASDNKQPASNGGSVGSNTITTASGAVYSYTRALTVSATAYSCEGYTGYTYSGTVARVGAIAVDPNVIPLGTKMYVVSNDGQYVYGYCVAEDIGGGIKGNRIDLYFDTFDECWDFGVRDCTVYILD